VAAAAASKNVPAPPIAKPPESPQNASNPVVAKATQPLVLRLHCSSKGWHLVGRQSFEQTLIDAANILAQPPENVVLWHHGLDGNGPHSRIHRSAWPALPPDAPVYAKVEKPASVKATEAPAAKVAPVPAQEPAKKKKAKSTPAATKKTARSSSAKSIKAKILGPSSQTPAATKKKGKNVAVSNQPEPHATPTVSPTTKAKAKATKNKGKAAVPLSGAHASSPANQADRSAATAAPVSTAKATPAPPLKSTLVAKLTKIEKTWSKEHRHHDLEALKQSARRVRRDLQRVVHQTPTRKDSALHQRVYKLLKVAATWIDHKITNA